MPPASPDKENDMTPIEAQQIKGITVKSAIAIVATAVGLAVTFTTMQGKTNGGIETLNKAFKDFIETANKKNEEQDKRMDKIEGTNDSKEVNYQALKLEIKILETRVDALERSKK